MSFLWLIYSIIHHLITSFFFFYYHVVVLIIGLTKIVESEGVPSEVCWRREEVRWGVRFAMHPGAHQDLFFIGKGDIGARTMEMLFGMMR